MEEIGLVDDSVIVKEHQVCVIALPDIALALQMVAVRRHAGDTMDALFPTEDALFTDITAQVSGECTDGSGMAGLITVPFTFTEAVEIQDIANPDEKTLMDYIQWGGMPQRFSIKHDDELKIFLSDLYDSIVLKDVVTRYKIQNIALLNKIIDYLSINTSQIFSGTSIANFLKSEKRDCSKESLYNYLTFITNSCIVNKISRYDIQGKRILSTLEKYYLTDVGLARIHSTKIDFGASLENIVYNELISRGYEVHIGILRNAEIDFIAQRGNQKEYFQVCYLLASEETIKREFGAFNSVKDNYPKYVLSLDKFDFSQDGIIHKNIIEWLLET